MQEKQHQLSKKQKSVIENIKTFNKSDEKGNFFILEQSKQKLIFEADITPSSKLLLIYFLSKIDYNIKHLYIHAPYSGITKETTINKSTAMRSLKELDKKGFLKLLSGKNRVENTLIKEFIFGQKQHTYDNQNQTNIIDMTLFFENFFKGTK